MLREVTKLAQAENGKGDKNERETEIERRLAAAEGKVDTLLFFFQQAAHTLRKYATVAPPSRTKLPDVPELTEAPPTTRVKIVRMVDAYAAAKMVTHQQVWNHLYGQLSVRFHFDAYSYGLSKKDPNYLEIVEENGQIDNLYAIAQDTLTASPISQSGAYA